MYIKINVLHATLASTVHLPPVTMQLVDVTCHYTMPAQYIMHIQVGGEKCFFLQKNQQKAFTNKAAKSKVLNCQQMAINFISSHTHTHTHTHTHVRTLGSVSKVTQSANVELLVINQILW